MKSELPGHTHQPVTNLPSKKVNAGRADATGTNEKTIDALKKRIEELEKENKKDTDLRNLKKSNELLYKEKKLLGGDLEEEKRKVKKLEEEMKELNIEGNSKTIEVDKDYDDEDDDWETGNDDEDGVENRDSSGEVKS